MLYYLTIFMAVYASATLALALLGTMSSLARFGARLLVAYIIMCACALYGVAASIFLQLFGDVGVAQWTVARAFRYTLCPAIGVSFEMENEAGMTANRPAVFVGNHQS
ncbi:1-acyl-sn-glycerol-3-phosphate acyltransferase [Drechslerella dactyloides]|uniref:1-acyl-sn-glycerol-3-phosphate acyltransferase n=1 Tax=Drechslerella dactyloides TaxID=74499 RepID=A0AAD6J3B2_DREDA|nr:1-acyl-sn-glycerol-3-phosphate acyltransferase [Drechslerella dactyloides]